MKKIVLILLCSFSISYAIAQLPEDALRLSWTVQSGTARIQAVGGAMGSLGGDITATFVNPAGLGFTVQAIWFLRQLIILAKQVRPTWIEKKMLLPTSLP